MILCNSCVAESTSLMSGTGLEMLSSGWVRCACQPTLCRTYAVTKQDEKGILPSSEIMVLQQTGLPSAWSAADGQEQGFQAWQTDNGR